MGDTEETADGDRDGTIIDGEEEVIELGISVVGTVLGGDDVTTVGICVIVGCSVGTMFGVLVGASVIEKLGAEVTGAKVGNSVGMADGMAVGFSVGAEVKDPSLRSHPTPGIQFCWIKKYFDPITTFALVCPGSMDPQLQAHKSLFA